MKYIVSIIALVVLVVAAKVSFFLMIPQGSESEKVVFDVTPGMSFNRVVENLQYAGLVSHPLEFKILGRLSGFTKKIKTGEYELHRGMKPLTLLTILASGKSIVYSFTFPEGLNIFEIAQTVEDRGIGTAQEFISLVSDRPFIASLLGEDLPSLEGYLFPDTYGISKHQGIRTLVTSMVKRFLEVYNELEPHRTLNFTRHQWVTLASIVEKETGRPEDRGKISSVFHNRLKKSMRLQTDPTVIYGKWVLTQKPVKNISRLDLQTKTLYNTYKINGLPYGPIANPGRDSLLAAFQPDSTDFLYFVSRNDGTTQFSTNLNDHNMAVKKFQISKDYRQGRSWRNLNKTQR